MKQGINPWHDLAFRVCFFMALFITLCMALWLSASGVMASEADTEETCRNAEILGGKMITDVPWNAMYPIRLAGMPISPLGDGIPDNATDKSLCSCQDDLGIFVPGVTQSLWEPARLIELVREPDCYMTLGGAKIEMTNGRNWGTTGTPTGYEGGAPGFWHYHYYAYPLLLMLEMVIPNRCGDGYMSMDLLYMSELDPTWNDSTMAFFANPEAAMFANPVGIASCIADAGAAAVGEPLDSLFWCAGAWGTLYPLSGEKSGKSSFVTKTSLLATRSVAALHRRLLARQTMGNEALCEAPIFPTLPKSQYKMNMMYPMAERQDAHAIGQTSKLWGEWRGITGQEDAVYLLWRYNDCCMTYY